jgi:hypothetical protein
LVRTAEFIQLRALTFTVLVTLLSARLSSTAGIGKVILAVLVTARETHRFAQDMLMMRFLGHSCAKIQRPYIIQEHSFR